MYISFVQIKILFIRSLICHRMNKDAKVVNSFNTFNMTISVSLCDFKDIKTKTTKIHF